MASALVFGASGQIGTPLVERLRTAGWQVHAVSRGQHASRPGLDWLRGDLAQVPGLPEKVDAIFSCGPLDLFADWYAQSPVEAARVVAFGSTSIDTKHHSPDPHERALADRLQQGEATVFATARARGAGAVVLRPTLVYGAGRDRSLTRLAGFARRWRCLPLPAGARGLRQPVHVDDLAEAALAACAADAAQGRAYALPGGETLPFREMVQRVLAGLSPRPRLLELPAPLFAVAVAGARLLGRGGATAGMLARLREDLVFDPAPAQRDLGFRPRPFRPVAAMFEAPV